jgi:hypothetical protein
MQNNNIQHVSTNLSIYVTLDNRYIDLNSALNIINSELKNIQHILLDISADIEEIKSNLGFNFSHIARKASKARKNSI